MTPEREQQLQDYIRLFNDSDADWSQAATLLAPEYRFSDPFHQLQGIDQLRNYLAYVHEQFPRVVFTPEVTGWQSQSCLLKWRFEAQNAQRQFDFTGVSELVWNDDHQICQHVDYWDAAEHFYSRLPLLGTLLNAVRRLVQRDFRRFTNHPR